MTRPRLRLGHLYLHTVPGPRRQIGNVLVDAAELGIEPSTLVGFENHSGKTYLGPCPRTRTWPTC